jgi:hypothetical protein
MPFRFTETTSPSGLRYLVCDTEGKCDIEDGRALEAWLLPGKPYHGGCVLSRVAKGTEYSPEVRKFFPTLNDKIIALAAVVTSPIVRAAINMMLRLIGSVNNPVRMFTTEEEAVAWLESSARSRSSPP